MRVLLVRLFVLSLWPGSTGAQKLCSSAREYTVDNCTACPTSDLTRHGNIPMAVCEERVTDTRDETSYTCVCGNFPTSSLVLVDRYYPHQEGNMTRCAISQSTAPYLHAASSLMSLGVLLYSAAHLLYISLLSRICCCSRHGCTKVNGAALSLGASSLSCVN